MSINHSELAKALLRTVADVAAPGLRENVENIIKLTRNGVGPEGGYTKESFEKSLKFAESELKAILAKEVLNGVPEFLRGHALYDANGKLLFGPESAPLYLPGGKEAWPEGRIGADSDAPKSAVEAAITARDSAKGIDPAKRNGFRFGAKSEAELAGVLPQLVAMARRALELTAQDFTVFDGLRTLDEQKKYVAEGTSKTLESKHRVQPDGFGHALDLVPFVNGQPSWLWERIYPVVMAVDRAATELGIAQNIVWGAAWDRRLSDFGGDGHAYKRAADEYAERYKAANPKGKPFLDGPHFEWRA